jgi:hypothetical protein
LGKNSKSPERKECNQNDLSSYERHVKFTNTVVENFDRRNMELNGDIPKRTVNNFKISPKKPKKHKGATMATGLCIQAVPKSKYQSKYEDSAQFFANLTKKDT